MPSLRVDQGPIAIAEATVYRLHSYLPRFCLADQGKELLVVNSSRKQEDQTLHSFCAGRYGEFNRLHRRAHKNSPQNRHHAVDSHIASIAPHDSSSCLPTPLPYFQRHLSRLFAFVHSVDLLMHLSVGASYNVGIGSLTVVATSEQPSCHS